MAHKDISRVGVVGFGTLGHVIAYHCVVAGYETLVFDKIADSLEKGQARIREWLAQKVKDGRLTATEAEAAMEGLKISSSLKECVAEVGLVIEVVPENLELKRQVFAEIDHLAPLETILATNSSSLPSSTIADVTGRPDKVLNMHFSVNLDQRMVDLMWGQHTSRETILAAHRFLRSLNLMPFLTRKEIMGFSFNRIWRAIKREALHLVDQGYTTPDDIDRAWMHVFHITLGPFGTMDMVGLDTVRDIEMQYYMASGDERDKPPKLLDDLIAQGRLGVKSKHGFYSYPNPDYEKSEWLSKEGRWRENLELNIAKKRVIKDTHQM